VSCLLDDQDITGRIKVTRSSPISTNAGAQRARSVYRGSPLCRTRAGLRAGQFRAVIVASVNATRPRARALTVSACPDRIKVRLCERNVMSASRRMPPRHCRDHRQCAAHTQPPDPGPSNDGSWTGPHGWSRTPKAASLRSNVTTRRPEQWAWCHSSVDVDQLPAKSAGLLLHAP
jgi:hypothetical protein